MADYLDSESRRIKPVAAIPFNSSGTATTASLDTIASLLGGSGAPAQVWKSYNSTSLPAAGSAAVIWDPASGKQIAITSVLISSYGTTAFRMQLYLGANGDLTYTAGTDQPVAVVSFIPSATVAPGVYMNFATPIIGTANHELMVQATAAGSVDIIVYGYEL